MIKSEAIIRAEYEHCKDVSIEVTLTTKRSLLYPEIVSLLEKCFETEPDITLHAIEGALDNMGGSND